MREVLEDCEILIEASRITELWITTPRISILQNNFQDNGYIPGS